MPVIATRGVKIRPLAYGPDFAWATRLGSRPRVEHRQSRTVRTLPGTDDHLWWSIQYSNYDLTDAQPRHMRFLMSAEGVL
jgi:hypothetical protein